MENENRSFDWGSFILGILSLILALFAFYNPAGGLAAIVFVFAIGAILKGIFELIYRNRLSRFRHTNKTALTVLGIVEILIGLLLLFNVWIGVVAVPFILAIWFIIDSIGALFMASTLRNVDNVMFWLTLIFGILGLILGILLLFNPITGLFTAAFLVGAFFMINGIIAIAGAF